jgi:hypothetical protein
MSTATETTTRRTITFSGLLLSLAIAVLFGVALAPDAAANKNKTKNYTSIQSRNLAQRQVCELGGGSLSVEKGAGDSMITECIGGTEDGKICTNSKKSTVCVQTRTEPGPLQDVTAPITGGNENPTGTGAAPGGGASPGGGAGGVDPGWSVDPGGSYGGGVVLTSYNGDQHDNAKHDGKRKHHGRNGKRGRN